MGFAFDEPGPEYHKPPPAKARYGGADWYGELSLIDGTRHRIIGTGLVDGADNAMRENDTSDGDEEFGV